MTDIHDVLHWANRTAVAQEITRRGYRVSGETLNRWYRQRSEVPAIVERIVFELFGTQQNAAPHSEERLGSVEGKVDSILANQGRLAVLIQQPPLGMLVGWSYLWLPAFMVLAAIPRLTTSADTRTSQSWEWWYRLRSS
jgi:hypothetical protein